MASGRNVLFRLRTSNFLVLMIFILIHSFRVDLRLLTDIVVYWPLQNAFHSFEFKRQCVYMHVIIYWAKFSFSGCPSRTKAWFQLVYRLYHLICVAIVARRTCLSKQFFRRYIHHGNNLAKKMEKCSLATRLLTDVWLHWRKEKKIWWIWTEANVSYHNKQPTNSKQTYGHVCVSVIWNWDWLRCSFCCYRWNCWPSLFNRSFHNGTWNSPNMRHSFIFLPKEECNW
jgi:hypothetical protein